MKNTKKTISASEIISKIHLIAIDHVYKYLSDTQVNICEFLLFQHRFPDLKNPKTFSEKIQWIKLYGELQNYSRYVDKYTIREFISRTIGEKYLIPIIGVYDHFEDINFDELPTRFVIKATHGSHYVYICHDKTKVNKNELKKRVNKWLKENFYHKFREIQYKNCQPRLIVEKYMEDDSGGLVDYKTWCFYGHPKYIEIISDRYSSLVDDWMDIDWQPVNIIYKGYPKPIKSIPRPKKLEEMLTIACQLSKYFPFVRVDLYYIQNRVYFGELTFTPANGTDPFDSREMDIRLGHHINLSKYPVKNIDP